MLVATFPFPRPLLLTGPAVVTLERHERPDYARQRHHEARCRVSASSALCSFFRTLFAWALPAIFHRLETVAASSANSTSP